jgi:hypothetical protein
MSVPRTSATAVEIPATSSELRSASPSPSTASGFSQCRVVKPSQVRLKRPWLSLNENATTTAIGANR